MSKFKRFLRLLGLSFAALTLMTSVALAGPTSPGAGSPTTPGALCLDDADTWIFCNTSATFGDTSSRIAEGWFTTLNTTTLTLGGATTGPILNSDGTAAAPSYSFSLDTNTGIYRSAADAIGFSLGGAQRIDLVDDATFDTMLKLMDTTATPLEFQIGNFASAAAFPRTYMLGGQDATDTNWAVRFAHKNSSSTTEIPVLFQISTNGDTSYTNADTLQFGIFTTYGLFASASGSSSAGPQLAIGTNGGTGLAADQVILISTVATGQAITLTHSAVTSGAPAGFKVVGPAHTGMTASTEVPGIDFDLDATKQWATGAITTQREFVLRAPTYGFVAASTITTAATLAVTGAPIAGTNATLTNTYSIWSQGGVNRFDGGIIGGTQTALGTGYVLDLKNTSSANVTMATTNSNSAGFAQMALFNNSGDSSVIDVFGSTYVTAAFQRNTLLGAGRSLYVGSNSSGGLSTATINLYTGGNPATPEFTMAGPSGNVTFSALASTSGSPAIFTITAPAHTTLAKNTEAVDVNINLARTVQFATVDTAFITQRAMLVQAPTYGFVGASTITVASTFSVTGGPLAGTNATISTGIGINSDSWGGTNATDVAALFSIPSIATSIGSVTERSALKITNGPSNILGDQTANLTNLYSVNITATTFTSTTNVRTVTGNVANLYIEGPHVASTNVTFTNTPYSIFVDAGASRFDGDIQFSKGIDTTAGDSATVNAIAGRFRKDTSGTTFTLTNSFITANSIIQLTYASDTGITGFDAYVVAGAGSAVINFTTSGVAAAPTSNADMNFLVIN